MALWRKKTAMSAIQQEIRQKKDHTETIVIRKGAFYHYWESFGFRPNERYECAGNRRAADAYVQNF